MFDCKNDIESIIETDENDNVNKQAACFAPNKQCAFDVTMIQAKWSMSGAENSLKSAAKWQQKRHQQWQKW